jgi:uncharacterized protein with GYD domain
MKFLWSVKYTADGIKGVLKEGGSARKQMTQKLIESLGGAMEAYYFAYGEFDEYVIVDLPSNEAAVAASLRVTAGGGATIATTVLLNAEEFDAAVAQNVDYRPPGA